MWPFKKKQPESQEEIAAEERLDEAAREEAHEYLSAQEELYGARPQDEERRGGPRLGGLGPATSEVLREKREAGLPNRLPDPGEKN